MFEDTFAQSAAFGQSTPAFTATPTPSRPASMETPSVGGRMSIGGSKPQAKAATIPVTCHLLTKTAFESFRLEGSDPSIYGLPLTTSMVCFTACIEKRDVEATNVTWKLDDGTGTITAKKYSSDDQEKASYLVAPEFSYVKVVGRLVTDRKTQSWYISVVKMVPVTNGDDLALGIMEAYACAMSPPTETAGVTIKTDPHASPASVIKSEPFQMKEPALSRPIKQEPVIKSEPVDGPAWLKPDMGIRPAVMAAIKEGGEAGIKKSEIVKLLAASFSADMVATCVKAIEDDGDAWTTTDEDTLGCV